MIIAGAVIILLLWCMVKVPIPLVFQQYLSVGATGPIMIIAGVVIILLSLCIVMILILLLFQQNLSVGATGPIMIIAGVVIILLSWCSALIEVGGRQTADTSMLRVRIFNAKKRTNSQLIQSIEANAIGKSLQTQHLHDRVKLCCYNSKMAIALCVGLRR